MCVSAPSVCAAHRQHTTRGQRLNSDHYAWQQGPLPTYHLHQQTALLSALESQKLGSFSKISMKQKPRHQGKSQEKWAGGFLRPSLIPGSLVFF